MKNTSSLRSCFSETFTSKRYRWGLPISLSALFLCLVFFSGCDKSISHIEGRSINFNHGWYFVNDSVAGAELADFDHSQWHVVNLPHDWSVEDYPVQDSLHIGPHNRNMVNGHDLGYLRGGTGWYRKGFVTPKSWTGNRIILHFDGVHSEADIWVNGKHAYRNIYGYTPFYVDIAEFLNPAGKDNIVAVRAYNPQHNSRWFTGSGIYRHVEISVLNPLHIDIWGVAVTTPEVSPTSAEVAIALTINNSGDAEPAVRVSGKLISPAGDVHPLSEVKLAVGADGKSEANFSVQLQNPMLWDLDSPNLYKAILDVRVGNRVTDHKEVAFGIRSIAYSAEKGFLLNGREVLMKGACMHHDNGLLGAAAFTRAEERKVQIMKQNGYNAIRTAHNPPSKAFLEACDRLGMLVIDEAFDMWVKPKRPNDYHRYFTDEWEHDLRAMMLRDRNHPSVVMWSIGNEIQERGDSIGLEINRMLGNYVRALDSSRPVTMGVCDTWDNPGKGWDHMQPAFNLLDVSGYNYQYSKYEGDHLKFPQRVIYGSESFPNEAYEYWDMVKRHPYVIGDFVWTGMDYIGEAGVAKAAYFPFGAKNPDLPFYSPWPCWVAWMGDIDLVGNKKAQSYYRDVVWGESNLELAVHEPMPEGHFELTYFWGWPSEYQSWNWKGSESMPLLVNVYSSYPSVRLELNGEVMGIRHMQENKYFNNQFTVPLQLSPRKRLGEVMKLTASFMVPYQQGELKAIGMVDGEDKEVKLLRTTGPVAALKLIAEQENILAHSSDIAYIQVIAVDKEGEWVPDANMPVVAAVSGNGTLLAAGNASPIVQGSFTNGKFALFNGRGLIVARSDGNAGDIVVEARLADISDKIVIKALPK